MANEKFIFRPHGTYDCRVEGAILIATTSGSWNIEMHRESTLRSRPYVELLEKAGPWGAVVNLTDTLVASLEVFEAGREALKALPESSRLVAIAWAISPQIEGYSLLVSRYRKMYDGLLPSAVFDTIAAAQQWVEKIIEAERQRAREDVPPVDGAGDE